MTAGAGSDNSYAIRADIILIESEMSSMLFSLSESKRLADGPGGERLLLLEMLKRHNRCASRGGPGEFFYFHRS
jgi:hypothetical protein